ncbi:MAG: hypothetical protein OEY41_00955 [Acidimicrobiia bacterium]|nr:hypothetical protein [Acidimicrobiia bacterium]
MNLGQRWQSAAERNELAMQRRAGRMFEDERFDALRGPLARRVVARTYVVVSLAMVASWFSGAITWVFGLVVWGRRLRRPPVLGALCAEPLRWAGGAAPSSEL